MKKGFWESRPIPHRSHFTICAQLSLRQSLQRQLLKINSTVPAIRVGWPPVDSTVSSTLQPRLSRRKFWNAAFNANGSTAGPDKLPLGSSQPCKPRYQERALRGCVHKLRWLDSQTLFEMRSSMSNSAMDALSTPISSLAFLLVSARSGERRHGSKRGRLEVALLGACGWKHAQAGQRKAQYER
jgi:hypothetical protein